MEILSPAGNPASLKRAVAAGADAVYLGYAAFSARAGAGNFDADALRDAVRFCHLHGVRVHVTVNTLVKDDELPEVLEVLRLLHRLRVDAVLIQDLGVLALARSSFPGLPVHASTQMAIHNAAGVRFCQSLGVRRVVLARECSLDEIRRCCGEGTEIEVFAHGAQCVSVSGECLFSSMLGDRSGNRGRCAQPCRLPYTYQGQTGAWLSPRDLCLRDELPALAEAGVSSIKIEGRLKSPAYVAEVTASYRRAEDARQAGRFTPADPAERQALLQAFHRGGFMPGHALGSQDAGIISPERANNGGVPLGRIEQVRGGMALLSLTLPLHDGDSLRIGDTGDEEMRYAGPERQPGEQALIRLRPGLAPQPGVPVYRLTDSVQEQAALSMPLPGIPVWMALRAVPGEPLRLRVSDGETEVCCTGDPVAAAQSHALTEEDARRSLGKTGDTPFTLTELNLTGEGAFVPVSALNQARREALRQLEDARCDVFALPMGETYDPEPVELPERTLPPVVVFRTAEQYAVLAGQGDMLPVWHPEDYRLPALEAVDLPPSVWFQLPTVCEEETLENLRDWLARSPGRFAGVVLGSVGQLGLSWPLPIAAGEGVPVMNRRAAAFLLARGCQWVTASPELTGEELRALTRGNVPIAVPVWGRTQLMLLHHCPARTLRGCTRGHADCDWCDQRQPFALRGTALTDRKGVDFPLLRQRLPEGCLVQLMNSLPTDNRSRCGGMIPQYTFTGETGEEAAAIRAAEAMETTTAGHWRRKIQ